MATPNVAISKEDYVNVIAVACADMAEIDYELKVWQTELSMFARLIRVFSSDRFIKIHHEISQGLIMDKRP